jgi:hypothetical protein
MSKSSLLRDFPSTTASFSSGNSIMDHSPATYYQLLKDNYHAQQAKLQAIRETRSEDFHDITAFQGSFKYQKAKAMMEVTGKEAARHGHANLDEEVMPLSLGSVNVAQLKEELDKRRHRLSNQGFLSKIAHQSTVNLPDIKEVPSQYNLINQPKKVQSERNEQSDKGHSPSQLKISGFENKIIRRLA